MDGAVAQSSPQSRVVRLPFRLPEYTRVGWTSEVAMQTWAPRFGAISAAWEALELASVDAGIRPSALRTVAPDDLTALTLRAAQAGLVALPLGREGYLGLGYQASAVPVEEGKPWTYRVAYTRPEHVAMWAEAWARKDNFAIGRLLGYPDCCNHFFQRTWVEQVHMDTTWPMGLGEVSGPPEANILLRWLNVRLVPHLPCRHDCEPTAALGRKYRELMHQVGHQKEAEWILDILSWPMEWSALHGIAEIKTPVCKISTATDATAHKLVVRRAGTTYPEEGASGLSFPYQAPTGVQITKGKSFARSIIAVTAADNWLQNGFSSQAAMDAAHDVLLAALSAGRFQPGVVYDPGCGNGLLLEKICAMHPQLTPAGVDADRLRALAAKRRLSQGDFSFGDLHDPKVRPGGPFELVVLYPGRLTEESDLSRRAATREHLLNAKWILCYAYSDNLQRPLVELMQEAGIPVEIGKTHTSTPTAEAMLVELVEEGVHA